MLEAMARASVAHFELALALHRLAIPLRWFTADEFGRFAEKMPIPLEIVYGERTKNRSFKQPESTEESAFLSYSHSDRALEEKILILFQDFGWSIYVDWTDDDLPTTPDPRTATLLKNRIDSNKWFLFLATRNSQTSKWCPWEIGYADSARGVNRVVVIPTSLMDNEYGTEYLRIYPSIDLIDGQLYHLRAGQRDPVLLRYGPHD
jgi:hypothetical protein